MSRAANLITLFEGRWFLPSKKDLLIELEYEPSVRGYVEDISKIRSDMGFSKEFIDAFLLMVNKSKTKVLSPKEIFKLKDIPATENSSLDDVKRIVTGYGAPKDWDKIVKGVREDLKLPMPMVHKKGSDLIALGGRTRLSAAALLGKDVEVILFEDSKLKPLFFDNAFKMATAIFILIREKEVQEYAKKYLLYKVGKGKKPPEMDVEPDVMDWVEDAYDRLKRHV